MKRLLFAYFKYKFEMDGSNVRGSYMRNSSVFNNTGTNRSYISTSLITDSMAYGDDLRKSRIQNLPNYKKINLGDQPQFVIVFQTIEIERLSNEVEVLRVRLKQQERILFNAQNYEVQIRELNEKLFSMERLREEYCEEIDKLTKISEQLYHENQNLNRRLSEMDYSLKQKYESEKQKNDELMNQLQKWKARYQASEKSKTKELEDLRNLMDCQRKSMIDREIREITIRFQNQRASLENEIRKNRQILENRNRELDDLRQKCQKYEISLMELRNYENIISDNQNKIVLLNQEVLRLNDVLTRKNDEIENLKQKEFKLNQQVKEQQQWEHENRQLRNTLESRNRELEEWKVRSSRLEEEVGKGREMIHYNQELSEKLQVSGKEIERLNRVLRTKLDEIEEWKAKFSKKQMQLSKLRNLEHEIANYESKISMIQAENDRVNGILKSRLGEVEDWKSRYGNLERKLEGLSESEKKGKILQEKLDGQVKNNQQLQHVLKKMESQIHNYSQNEVEYKQSQRENEIMMKEIDRLNGVIKNYANEVEDYRTRQSRMEKMINEFKNDEMEIKELNYRINVLTQEKQRLNNLIRSKNDDIQGLENEKLELHTKINHYRNYEVKITESEQITSRLNNQIAKLRKDIEAWQDRNRQSENKARELEKHLYENNNQKEKLSSIIKSKNYEYEDLRNKYSRLEGDTQKISELESILQEQHNQILAYSADIEHLERNLKESAAETQREKQIGNEFAYKIIVLSCEIERMAVSGSTKSSVNTQEFQQMEQNYVRLQNKVVSKNNEIDILNSKISSLQKKVKELTNQFNRLLTDAQKSDQETLILVRKIEEYQDYAKRIHILGAEIDRLRAENKAFDEDAKRIRLKFADGLALDKKQEDTNLLTVLMALEIESLRSRVDQREVNIDEMRKSILEPVRRI